jgi:hypothetical protein
MRPRLLHPLGEARHSRRHRRRGGATASEPSTSSVAPTESPAEVLRAISPDRDVQRVQEAGGPTDHASYSCACGYFFSADVSTTVTCPHCGTGQAW